MDTTRSVTGPEAVLGTAAEADMKAEPDDEDRSTTDVNDNKPALADTPGQRKAS
ncbi:hypothetical protein JCM19000A_05290 [Silvimonas sp. JCM 19000]